MNNDKLYYKNILIKLKNRDFIVSVGVILSFSKIPSFNFKMVNRFYKIYTFENRIPLEVTTKIINKIFPIEIADKVLMFYLKNDVSFKAICSNNSNNTFKITNNIQYIDNLNSYQCITENQTIKNNDNIKEECMYISSMFSKNIKKLLNDKNSFDVSNIFKLDNMEKD